MICAPRDMLIVKVHYKETLAGGNIVIPETYGGKENVMEYFGEVVSVGPKCPFRDEVVPGDKIGFQRNEGITIKDAEGKEYKSLNPRAVLCKDNL
jgi:co-chaperonin GroES (HSP10)